MDARALSTVVLYRTGQNLNRAYRTCEFFGVKTMEMCQCSSTMAGNLFGAKGRVDLRIIDHLPRGSNTLWFETNGKVSIDDVDWSGIDTIVLGGETYDLRDPGFKNVPKVRIPGIGKVSGLTVEAALAIVLNEHRRNACK